MEARAVPKTATATGEGVEGALGTYDDYADEYAAYTRQREAAGADSMGMLPVMLDLLGDLSGLTALDAGCGEGYLARIMAARGARVTGIDVSPRLIQMARENDPHGAIAYHVADLSTSLPGGPGRFDVVGSCFVLDDVPDYRGFIATVAAALKPGGRAVLSLNNPYASVVRKRIANYFATDTTYPPGLAAAGIRVRYYYRTLADYLDAFFRTGLQLTKLVDVDQPAVSARRAAGQPLPPGEQLPHFLVLAFRQP